MDGDRAFDWYYGCFEQLREYSSDDITSKALTVADDAENIEEIPIAQTVKLQKALVIEPQTEARDDVRFVLDVKNLAGKFASFVPKPDKKGKIMLVPETLKQTRRRLVDANIQEKELRSEYPQLAVEELKSDDDAGAPDVLAVSSEIICSIIRDYADGKTPFFVRELTLEDYFSEKVTGSHAIKTIQNAWKINRKAFVVDKKFGQLRYNAGQVWEVDRIIKELPEDLEAHKSREWVIMDLDKACAFFGVDFRKLRLFGGQYI